MTDPFYIQVFFLVLFFLLERFFPFFQYDSPGIFHGFRHLVLGLINGVMSAIFFVALTLRVMMWTQNNQWGLLRWWEGPVWIELIIAVFLFDAWMYGWHRLNHEMPFLWRFHKVHHSDVEMDCTTALRFHFGEILISSCLRLGVFALLGMSLGQFLIYEILLHPIILFHHSNMALPASFDRLLRGVIVTPGMHRVHHSQKPVETDSNYGTIFSFWDRLFGSFRQRARPKTIRFGLLLYQDPSWQGIGNLLKMPFRQIP